MKNAGELSRVYITVNGVKVKKMKEKLAVMRSRSRENLTCGHSTLLGRKNVERTCRVLFLLINPIVLCRSRFRLRRRCLSSLVTILKRLFRIFFFIS